jgi:hypothetical protein
MALRLVTDKELKISIEPPTVSTTDISFRRLQRFTVNQASKYKWSMVRSKNILQTGEVHLDKQGVITIEKLRIYTKPATLIIKPE